MHTLSHVILEQPHMNISIPILLMKNMRFKKLPEILFLRLYNSGNLAKISNHFRLKLLFFILNYTASCMRILWFFHALYNIQHTILHRVINHMLANLLISYIGKLTLVYEPKTAIFGYMPAA